MAEWKNGKITKMVRSDFTVSWANGKYTIYDKVFDDTVHVGAGSHDDAEKWIEQYLRKIN